MSPEFRAPLHAQNVIAVVWDFDKTVSPTYMQDPLFRAFDVDGPQFWREVGGLMAYYRKHDYLVSRDSAYLAHILTYVEQGRFAGLTNQRLRELGADIELAPGMPDWLERSRQLVAADPRFARHGVTVEHYVVSNGLRQMIEGSAIRPYVDGVWANELLADPPGPGYLDRADEAERTGVLKQIGYTIDSVGKTNAIFQISKGVNVEPAIDVNAVVRPEQYRVPVRNVIYIADGPSDIPAFSLVNRLGGKTLGVWTSDSNYDGVRQLQDDRRIHGMAKADYTPGSEADRWLLSSLRQIATDICDRREQIIGAIRAPAGHSSAPPLAAAPAAHPAEPPTPRPPGVRPPARRPADPHSSEGARQVPPT